MKNKSYSSYTIILLISIFVFSISPTNSAVNGSPEEVNAWFRNQALDNCTRPEKMTKLHFYFHDQLEGKHATSTLVAQANMTASSPTFFGSLMAADDPLTVGPELGSKRVGYARGFYEAAAMKEVGLVHAMSFVFMEGAFNGSTLSVFGYNPYNNLYREIPVVGGTGVFRLARGLSTWQTHFFDAAAGNATVEIDVTVLHY